MVSLDITIYWDIKTDNNAGQHVAEVAKAYLEQAIDDTQYTPNITLGNDVFDPYQDYSGDGTTGGDTCPQFDDVSAFINQQPDASSNANHIILWEESTCPAGSNGYSSWSDQGKDLDTKSTNPTEVEPAGDAAGAVTTVLHEVGHSILDSSVPDDHLLGANSVSGGYYDTDNKYRYSEYYVTPMLQGYDRQFHGQENGCDGSHSDYIEDPANADSIYYDHLWSSCMKSNIDP